MGRYGDYFVGFVPEEPVDERNIWVYDNIWEPFFRKTQKNSRRGANGPTNETVWKELTKRLSIVGKCDSGDLLNRMKGGKAWAGHGRNFLEYHEGNDENGIRKKSKDSKYCIHWATKVFSLNSCVGENGLFSRFCDSIPAYGVNDKGELQPTDPQYLHTMAHLPVAIQISEYLKDIEKYFSLPLPAHDEAWLNAGMFSLICLFLQNEKGMTPAFLIPPYFEKSEEHNEPGYDYRPSTLKEINKIYSSNFTSAQESFGAPETGVLPFDLFSRVQNFFQEQIPEDIAITTAWENQNASIITPAEIHRKQIRFSQNYPLNNPFQVFQSGLFLIDKHLFQKHPSSCQYFIRQSLRAIPCRTDTISREYQIETNCFEDNVAIDAVFLDCKEDLHFCFVIPVRFSDTGINWPSASTKGKNYFTLSIDEYGHSKQHHLEHILDAFQIAPLQQETIHQPAERTATVSFRREYLDFQFINVDTMVEIPITQSRNEATGEYQLNLTVPCPCTLAIIRNAISSLTPEEAELLQLSGYLHGIYGLKKNQDLAIAIMKAKAGCYPQLAFQYGAYLRTHGSINDAESHLRQAAEHGIPGAQFELAALLKEKNTTEALVEAEQLLDILWKQGYRTYGVHTSVDLLNKYST